MSQILPILFLAACVPSLAVAGQTTGKMSKSVYGQQLSYLLHVPSGNVPKQGRPLLLFLHGAGERGDQLAKVKVHGPPKLTGKIDDLKRCVVVSPQCPAGGWWKPEVLKVLLDEVIEKFEGTVDTSRLYCTGLSMGGYGTWGLVSKYPDLFAAAAPICGGGDIKRLKARVSHRGAPDFDIKELERAKDLPIWAFHGAADPVVPQKESELLVDALKAAGAKSVKLTSYPGVGHDSWTRTYNDPAFYKWLFAQERGD